MEFISTLFADMARTRSKTQKKLVSPKSKSQSTSNIPQRLAEEESINYANNYAEHPENSHEQETKPVTCTHIDETPSFMVSIPTDVLSIFNTITMHHINNIGIKEELSDDITSSSDMCQHETFGENKITGQSILFSLPKKILKLAPLPRPWAEKIIETSDIGDKCYPVLDAKVSKSEENSEMENFIKATSLDHNWLGATFQMNLNPIEGASHDESGIEVFNLDSPKENEFETMLNVNSKESASLSIKGTTLNMCDEISMSELKMSALLSTEEQLSRELNTREHIMSSELLHTTIETPPTALSTTTLASLKETHILGLTQQSSQSIYENDIFPANKQGELTELNIDSPSSPKTMSFTYPTIDEIVNDLSEKSHMKFTSPAATVIKDEEISPEITKSSVEHPQKVLITKLFRNYDSLPERTENKSILENTKFKSKTSKKRLHDADPQNSSKRGRREHNQCNKNSKNQNIKLDRINQSPGKSESEFFEINSDQSVVTTQQGVFTCHDHSKWSSITFSASPEVSLEESDYGWEDPPPPQPTVSSKLTLEVLEQIVEEKTHTCYIGLLNENNLDVIESNKKNSFNTIEESIVDLSKKKLAETDYIQQLLGTDNFRYWNNETLFSNINKARKVEPNLSVSKNGVKVAQESAPSLDYNKPVFYGRIKQIETEFLGRDLPPYLIDILKQEKRQISDLVIKWLMPHYHDGKIQPKNTFSKVAREISHIFYGRYADETVIKKYIDDRFRT